jgi:hypothetical protein
LGEALSLPDFLDLRKVAGLRACFSFCGTALLGTFNSASIPPIIRIAPKQQERKALKRTWSQRFKASSAHMQASIVFSAVIMVATIAYSIIAGIQLHVMRKASEDNATQTEKLIKAANINDDAARQIASASDRNAKAAEDFAKAADNINTQMINAVGKLNLQANQTLAQAKATNKLANTAKQIYDAANRPYVGFETEWDLSSDRQTFNYRIGAKNFGTVPASDLQFDWTVKFGGRSQESLSRTRPNRLYPTQAVWRHGQIAHDVLINGTTLEISATVSYTWPGGEDSDCEIFQYSPTFNSLNQLGPCTRENVQK